MGKSMSLQPGGLIKSYIRDDGTVGIEGWISTDKKDLDKDVIEPESFQGEALDSYMHRGAPVSVEHNTKTMPVGYLTKAVLVRDGDILQEAINPKQEGRPFLYFKGGTGWYGNGTVYDRDTARHVVIGTLGSFSWIGMPRDWDSIPGGGRHFKRSGSISPLIETTLTAYPINSAATMRIAKAQGALPPLKMTDLAQLMLDPEIGEDIINLLAPSLRGQVRGSFNDVLDLASARSLTYGYDRSAGRKVKNYFGGN